jgi:mRNA interferase RelE/StbE
MFSVFMDKDAIPFIERLPNAMKSKIKRITDTLKEDPVPIEKFDIVKLAGEDSFYRIRIGKIRPIYSINWKTKEIFITSVARRSDATYKRGV